MNLPDYPSGSAGKPPQPPKKELQLQGPRPPPLRVSKESHKIKKPPPHPPQVFQNKPLLNHHQHHQQQQQQHQPVIIYAVSPKVIHATVSDFMSTVQRLTGSSSSSSFSAAASGAGDISPAARLASIEKTSPSERDRERSIFTNASATTTTTGGDLLGGVEVEMGHLHPGILSPAPSTLAPISSGFFSPVTDPQNFSLLHDLSPLWYNGFMSSPSGLFSAPLVTPSPSSMEIFNSFLNF